MQDVLVLGSTGSIGVNALRVLTELSDRFRVVGLAAAGGNVDLIAEQARTHRVPRVALANGAACRDLRAMLTGTGTEILEGPDGIVDLVRTSGAHVVIAAISGAAGLPASLETVRTGARLALANKETCVAAGHILTRLAKEHGAEIIPVDSEHSAIFQSMRAGAPCEVRRILLTASGGPFRAMAAADLEHVTVEDALRHPTWSMGKKITIDSATLMNKALEVVEAHWLFDVPAERIRVVVHPQSVVHSMVEFRDGSVVAQLGRPDMKLPIRYALTHPDRPEGPPSDLGIAEIGRLTFEEPDTDRFPALTFAFDAVRRGGTAGAVLNAANEAAVELFIEGRLGFLDISRRVGEVLSRHEIVEDPDIDQVMRADRWAREEIAACPTS
jgi:1-deoxy-D-xylulose-5-phosphate reductoisomerase